MAITGNGSLATILFLFMFPAALHKGRALPMIFYRGGTDFSPQIPVDTVVEVFNFISVTGQPSFGHARRSIWVNDVVEQVRKT